MELGKARNAHSFHAVHDTFIRVDIPGNEAKDGGFSGAVATNEAYVLALFHAKVDGIEDFPAGIGFTDVLKTYQAH